jgi:hypothetical protein
MIEAETSMTTPAGMAIFQRILFSWGANPVFGRIDSPTSFAAP